MAAKKGIAWDELPLGQLTDPEIGRMVGCTGTAVGMARRARGIPAVNQQRPPCDPGALAGELGRMKDREVAKRHGLSEGQVSAARRKLGIASTRINWSKQPLGTVPDIVLAKRHGVNNKVVAQARWRRGIDKWQEERQCPCGDTFVAVHRRQRYCSTRCQRYHWQLVNQLQLDPAVADVRLALRAYRKTLERRA